MIDCEECVYRSSCCKTIRECKSRGGGERERSFFPFPPSAKSAEYVRLDDAVEVLRHRMDGYVTRPHSVDSLIHAPHCAQHAIHDPHGIWCGKNQKAVETMDGSTGVCETCTLNTSIENISLKARCERIRQIDVALHNLFEEQRQLYHDGLSQEQSNRLHRMVMSDGKPHFT